MRAPVLVALLLTAGCLGSDPAALEDCQAPELVTFGPNPAPDGLPRAPGDPVPVAVWARNPTETTANVSIQAGGSLLADPGAPRDQAPVMTYQLEPNETAFTTVHGTVETANVTARLEGVGPCLGEPVASEPIPLAPPAETERGEGGRGVLVHTVGWWVNGSSFYTNLDRYHDDPATPKGYDGYGGGDALKVYVYNESRDEMPPRYERAGYLTTIPGFNEALKGIATQGARLTYLEPDQAYTRPGYEDHTLYGDALIFYIEAVDVTTVPCEVPEPPCDIPRTPEPPGARQPSGFPQLGPVAG